MEVGDQGVHDLESIAGIDEDSGAPLSCPNQILTRSFVVIGSTFQSPVDVVPTEMILPPARIVSLMVFAVSSSTKYSSKCI